MVVLLLHVLLIAKRMVVIVEVGLRPMDHSSVSLWSIGR